MDKMQRKYVISLDEEKNSLCIREYAVIEKRLNKVVDSMLKKGSFTLLCEENYESNTVASSIAKGTNALVASLRTHNIFPIEPYAKKIAESVIALYSCSENGSVELFFNDLDMLVA
jgi:hypothetical protein